MENILNLKTYNKYINLITEGLLLIPDQVLSDDIKEVENAHIVISHICVKMKLMKLF